MLVGKFLPDTCENILLVMREVRQSSAFRTGASTFRLLSEMKSKSINKINDHLIGIFESLYEL